MELTRNCAQISILFAPTLILINTVWNALTKCVEKNSNEEQWQKKATPFCNATALMLSRVCLHGVRVGCTMPLILLINFLLLITYSQRDRNFIAYTRFFPIGFVCFLFHEKKDCSHSTEMELQRTICTILTFISWTMKELQSPKSFNLSIMNKFLKVRHFVENYYAIQIM